MTAIESLKKALEGKTRGFRGDPPGPRKETPSADRRGTRQLVEVYAADVLEACDLVKDPDQIVKDLRMGSSAGKPDRFVVILADDCFHLVEKAGG